MSTRLLKLRKSSFLQISLGLISLLTLIGFTWGSLELEVFSALLILFVLASVSSKHLDGKLQTGMMFYGIGTASLSLIGDYLSYACIPFGTSIVVLLKPLFFMGAFAVLLIYFLGNIYEMTFNTSKRIHSLKSVVLASLLLVILVFSLKFGNDFRMHAFAAMGERFSPLINAIKLYEKENGVPPRELKLLEPKYLAKVPTSTGLASYPEFHYETVKEADHSWEISVPCSSGLLNWDVFFYWPSEKYPSTAYGGVVEPINNWAYVYE